MTAVPVELFRIIVSDRPTYHDMLPLPAGTDLARLRIIYARDLRHGDLVLGDCDQPTRRGMHWAGHLCAPYVYDATRWTLAKLNLNPDELITVIPAERTAEHTAVVHLFDTSSDAYDASQCRENIHDGDILAALPERVVGFLHKAWPVAVTRNHGAFHGIDWKATPAAEKLRYRRSVQAAKLLVLIAVAGIVPGSCDVCGDDIDIHERITLTGNRITDCDRKE
jgi:hypothetical protein